MNLLYIAILVQVIRKILLLVRKKPRVEVADRLLTMSDDATTYDAILPPEYQACQKQYEIPVPDDYYDIW